MIHFGFLNNEKSSVLHLQIGQGCFLLSTPLKLVGMDQYFQIFSDQSLSCFIFKVALLLSNFRFVKKYKKPLSSDALSGFASSPNTKELNQNVLDATLHLFDKTISSFSAKLCENIVAVNAKYLHSKRTPYTPFG